MKLLVYLVLILVCAANLFAHASEKEATARLPADVAKFKERRDICDHFRGEEPYDAERRKFLEENLNKYCTGTDKELASLKAKYKNNKTVMKVLGVYEDKVEASSF